MSLRLFRLGQWSFRNRWSVIGAWAAIVAVVVSLLASQGGARISSAITIDGTESERVINELHKEFPEMSGSQGTIVFRSEDGSRLDEEPSATGLKTLAHDLNSLPGVAERGDLRELLPGIDQIPDGIDVDAVQGFISALPQDANLSDYQHLLATLPTDIDMAQVQSLLSSLPADTDLAGLREMMSHLGDEIDLPTLQQTLSNLPEHLDIAQLRQRLASVPPEANPAQLQQMIPDLPEDVDLQGLRQTLTQIPPNVDLDVLHRIFKELPVGMDVAGLSKLMKTLPADVNLSELHSLVADLPENVNLTEMQSFLEHTDGDLEVDTFRDLFADLPAGTKMSEVQSVMDISLLRVDGEQVPEMLLSADGRTVMFQIQLATQIENLADDDLTQIIALAQNNADELNLEVFISESLKPHTAPLGGSEIFGLLVAALVLILTLGSLRAAGLPLITALVGVGVGLGGALALSHTIELTSATPVLALMVGLAVGIDYALFIVNRARALILNEGQSAYTAVGQAVGTAGSAVVFAGLTVVIALGGLTLIGISFLTIMALVAAITVVLAVLVALTLLPALLGLIGEHLVSQRARTATKVATAGTGFATRWARRVISLRGIVTAVIVVSLGVMAIPATSMTLGMPNGSTANHDTDERQAYDAISEGFGEGYNAPLITVTHAPPGEQISAIDLPLMALSLRDIPGVLAAQPMGLSSDGSVAIVSVIPEHGPDALSTADLVHDLRDTGTNVIEIDAASFGVTGLTAVNLDISEKLAKVLPIYITIIVILSLIVLLLVFRSILIPLKATIGFLLSIGATFGIITAVFQWGWAKELFGLDATGPILSFLPIMVTGILYGLAMDYEMFLVTSMRQAHVQGNRGNVAITEGFTRASRVVVAAAAIMVAVFAGFIFSSDSMVKQFGTALAIGILIDAFLIRLTLIPAIMSFLGERAWWLPRWMNRILPNLDVEGHTLNEHLQRNKDQVL